MAYGCCNWRLQEQCNNGSPPRPSSRSFCKADSGNAGWRGVQGWGGEAGEGQHRRARAAVCGLRSAQKTPALEARCQQQ
jgi:hypothetical protein